MKKSICGGLVSLLMASSLSFCQAQPAVNGFQSVSQSVSAAQNGSSSKVKPFLSKAARIQLWYDFINTEEKREWLDGALDMREQYVKLVKTAAETHNVPPDALDGLLMIESGYNKSARSRAGAVGIAQFTWETGKKYGLIVYDPKKPKHKRWADYRTDPAKSIDASAHYLSDIYKVFGDWDLVLAAYNCGEDRVARALVYDKTSSFWELKSDDKRTRMDNYHRIKMETYNHVPLVRAAIKVLEEKKSNHF